MVNQLAFVKHGILVQTLLCIRESNTLYLPQVKVDCVVTAIHIYIYHITGIQEQELGHCQKPKLAGCLSWGAMQSLILCIPLLSSLCPGLLCFNLHTTMYVPTQEDLPSPD